MDEAALFKRCRQQLELSVNDMARTLAMVNDRNLRRWEDGKTEVSGPAWVAIRFMLGAAYPNSLLLREIDEAIAARQRRFTT